MHDGFAKVLTKAGYSILHEYSDRGTFGDRDSVRVVILKDGERVLEIEQNWNSRGGESLARLYQKAALDLGVIKPFDRIQAGPVDLEVTTEQEGGQHESLRFRHPSFGVVTLSRYSGDQKLFMSPINTAGGMSIRVHAADLSHDVGLGIDRVYPGPALLEFSMSFTQFAEWITSAGVGAGVPCTLKYAEGVSIQGTELPTAEERLEANAEESMRRAVADLHAFVREIEPDMTGPGALSPKRKREIWERLRGSLKTVAEKPSWLMRIWREHVAETVMHARSEFAHWAHDWTGRHDELQARIRGDAPTIEPRAPKPLEGQKPDGDK